VVAFIILLAVLGILAYRVTSPVERARYLDIALKRVRELRVAATQRHPESDAFRDVLRARTRYVLIMPAIAAISVAVFVSMLFGAGAISDPNTLVGWGASLGTRTTNGEWWRLVTSTFVHTGMLHLFVNVAILIQLGAILERLLGRLTVAAVYISAGAFTGLINLSSHPVAVSVGASGAVFGLYGLLIASLIWQAVQGLRRDRTPDAEEMDPPPLTIPLTVMKRLGYGAALFIVYNVVSGFASAAEFTGLLVGLAYGLVLGHRAATQHPRTRYVAAAIAASGVIALACAAPLRNIVDVKPEIARVVATEERTAAAYQSALDAFRKGRMTADALAKLAEGTIMSALQTVDARLQALGNVPPEHQPLVSDAREYVRLRCVSWRLRADAIRRTNAAPRRAQERAADASGRLQMEARFRSNLAAEGSAESAERASMEMFHRIRP
jgi:membrane associated rhomboid family serine protease